jgi:indolepyruvate ferredoxin oxidoreductase
MNKAAFRWGRRAVLNEAEVENLARPAAEGAENARHLSQSFEEIVARRVAFLTTYQSARYARRYRRWVDRAQAAEASKVPGKTEFAEAVARYLFKLMAYKDEYEVARLFTDGAFAKQLANEFDAGEMRLEFHLAPPLLARRDRLTGQPKKMSFGPWLLPVFRGLAKLRVLRGTPLDPFGYSLERRTERRLIVEYETMLNEVLARLSPANHHLAVGLAAIPEKIRGFGHVKMRHLSSAKGEEAALMDQLRAGEQQILKAAE